MASHVKVCFNGYIRNSFCLRCSQHLYVYVYVLIVLSLRDCTSNTYTVVPERGQNNCDCNKNWLHDEKHGTIKSKTIRVHAHPLCISVASNNLNDNYGKATFASLCLLLRVWNTFAVTMRLKSIQNYVQLPFLLNAESAHDNC